MKNYSTGEDSLPVMTGREVYTTLRTVTIKNGMLLLSKSYQRDGNVVHTLVGIMLIVLQCYLSPIISWRLATQLSVNHLWMIMEHWWKYLTVCFSEWELFQTKADEKFKTYILYSRTSFWKSCHLWDKVEKYRRARLATMSINTPPKRPKNETHPYNMS